jgi:hypothetical protein
LLVVWGCWLLVGGTKEERKNYNRIDKIQFK